MRGHVHDQKVDQKRVECELLSIARGDCGNCEVQKGRAAHAKVLREVDDGEQTEERSDQLLWRWRSVDDGVDQWPFGVEQVGQAVRRHDAHRRTKPWRNCDFKECHVFPNSGKNIFVQVFSDFQF